MKTKKSLLSTDLSTIGGLHPTRFVIVGEGFNREEIKAIILSENEAISGISVTSLSALAARIESQRSQKPRAELSGWARQEILRSLMGNKSLSQSLSLLNSKRRGRTFFEELDRAIQKGRSYYAHFEEYSAMHATLESVQAKPQLFDEIAKMAFTYDAFLEAQESLTDSVSVFRRATEAIRENHGVLDFLPRQAVFLSTGELEGVEHYFFQALSEAISIEVISSKQWLVSEGVGQIKSPISIKKAHTFDDCAEFACDEFLRKSDLGRRIAWVIPDDPEIRRSLSRSVFGRGLWFKDPRDPIFLKTSERHKAALLPLKVWVSDFEKNHLHAWARMRLGSRKAAELKKKLERSGFRKGAKLFQERSSGHEIRKTSAQDYSEFKILFDELAIVWAAPNQPRRSRWTISEVVEGLEKIWSVASVSRKDADRCETLENELGFEKEISWLRSLAEKFDGEIHEMQLRARFSLLWWNAKLEESLPKLTPPTIEYSLDGGIDLFRLSQVSLENYDEVWIFGLSQGALQPNSGGLWFTEQCRELLSRDFSILGAVQLRLATKQTIQTWLSEGHVTLWDAEFDWTGREREPLDVSLIELGLLASGDPVTEYLGAHARWLKSFGTNFKTPPVLVRFADQARLNSSSVSATELDLYSRCHFLGLASKQWKLDDTQESSADLWADLRGRILHSAVFRAMSEYRETGFFQSSPAEWLNFGFEEVEKKEGSLGWAASLTLRKQVIVSLEKILERFIDAEKNYLERSQSKIKYLEGPKISYELGGVKVTGVPDRIDESIEGKLFVIDYKTSGGWPKATEMIDLGYRLQLPFYAVALQDSQEVAGVQFIELTMKHSRARGIFFSQFNGKTPGSLTQFTARNQSVLQSRNTHDVWHSVKEQLARELNDWKSGIFDVKPKNPKDCTDCRVKAVCGRLRQSDDDADDSLEGEG